jgi:hypothetical protein
MGKRSNFGIDPNKTVIKVEYPPVYPVNTNHDEEDNLARDLLIGRERPHFTLSFEKRTSSVMLNSFFDIDVLNAKNVIFILSCLVEILPVNHPFQKMLEAITVILPKEEQKISSKTENQLLRNFYFAFLHKKISQNSLRNLLLLGFK